MVCRVMVVSGREKYQQYRMLPEYVTLLLKSVILCLHVTTNLSNNIDKITEHLDVIIPGTTGWILIDFGLPSNELIKCSLLCSGFS